MELLRPEQSSEASSSSFCSFWINNSEHFDIRKKSKAFQFQDLVEITFFESWQEESSSNPGIGESHSKFETLLLVSEALVANELPLISCGGCNCK